MRGLLVDPIPNSLISIITVVWQTVRKLLMKGSERVNPQVTFSKREL